MRMFLLATSHRDCTQPTLGQCRQNNYPIARERSISLCFCEATRYRIVVVSDKSIKWCCLYKKSPESDDAGDFYLCC